MILHIFTLTKNNHDQYVSKPRYLQYKDHEQRYGFKILVRTLNKTLV